MKENEIAVIKTFFGKNEIVDKESLIGFITSALPNKKREYSRFYLNDILNRGVAYPVRTGFWAASGGREQFSLGGNSVDAKIVASLQKVRPTTTIAVWNTAILNGFMELQSFHSNTIVSSFAYCLEDISLRLKTDGFFPIPLKSYQKERHISWPESSVLISSMNEDAPLFRFHKRSMPNSKTSLVAAPRLEKILVDCYCGDVRLDPSQVNEVFAFAIKHYFLNFSVLEHYAKTRGKKEEIVALLAMFGIKEVGHD